MDDLYDQMLSNMEASHAALAARVPQPKKVASGFRYVERDIRQALVQKLARIISGLHAARLLLAHGFVQEQAALQRMLDEFNEDVIFLAHGAISGDVTELHRKYLAAFYEEEFDNPDSAMESTQKRPTVSRQKIRAYLARLFGDSGSNGSLSVEAMRTVSKVHSGFVHGASPHIMDMYGGDPPRWHVRGMLGTIRADEHREVFSHVFYRSIGSFFFAAKAFNDKALVDNFLVHMRRFARETGDNYAHPPGEAPDSA